MIFPADWIVPDWPAPARVRALITTRSGGVSKAPYAGLNLGAHVGDDPASVAQNRAVLRRYVPGDPLWLSQVHGCRVVTAGQTTAEPQADACMASAPNAVCAVLTADCLPLLLCAEQASAVGVAHAGWRGLAGGVVESSVAAMGVEPARLLAYLGPAIGPRVFEVGDEVRQAFLAHDIQAADAFAANGDGKWLADLYLLTRQRLARLGVHRVFGGGYCTYSEPQRFFSFRRDRDTGRMATLIWLAE